MTNRNQTDTNGIAHTETKYQTDFYSAEKYQYLFKKTVLKIPIKYQEKTYQEIWDRITKNRFGIGIFLVYRIIGYRLASLPLAYP